MKKKKLKILGYVIAVAILLCTGNLLLFAISLAFNRMVLLCNWQALLKYASAFEDMIGFGKRPAPPYRMPEKQYPLESFDGWLGAKILGDSPYEQLDLGTKDSIKPLIEMWVRRN